MISLTAGGKESACPAEKAVDEHVLKFFGQISEPARQELHRLLARLIERPA